MPDPITQDLLAYIAASPTPMHCVAESARRLTAAGFTQLDERDSWATLGPGAYYTTTTGTNLIAFVVPEERTRFHIVGAHTDSPNLRLKPNAEYATEGYAQLGVEVYGGVLLNSWLDRDCGLAGRVFRRDGADRLIRIDKPLLRVAQLAIHLDRDVNDKGLILNKQDHLAPLFGLTGTTPSGSLKQLVADAAQIEADEIVAYELQLFDLTAPTLGGAHDELIFSARLDNQASCHAALTALLQTPEPGDRRAIAVVALFDHEEVGSDSVAGAGSAVLPRVLERLIPDRDAFHAACARSTCISADMSHAVHPNYASRHEPRHKPQLNGGPVIKTNTNQRYATTAATGAMFAELCNAERVPVQYYNHRTDLPCGSTIGPITSTLLGIPTVDVGNPMLSMHSARELGGADDPPLMTKVLARYLRA